MAFLNPFANLGIRTPSIATPSIAGPSIFAPFLGSYATPGSTAGTVPGPVAPSAPLSDADYRKTYGLTENFGKSNVPLTSWYTNPSDYVKMLQNNNDFIKSQPAFTPAPPPTYNWGPTQLSWAMPTKSAAQFNWANTTTPAAKPAVKAPAAKTPVTAAKTK